MYVMWTLSLAQGFLVVEKYQKIKYNELYEKRFLPKYTF